MSESSKRLDHDTVVSWRFKLKIDKDLSFGPFTSIEGFTAEYVMETVQEGGQNGFEHHLPGLLKFGNIKLSRPIDSSSPQIAGWFTSMRREQKKVPVTITGYTGLGTVGIQWEFANAFPVRYTGPSFKSDGNNAATETLEFSHEGFGPPTKVKG